MVDILQDDEECQDTTTMHKTKMVKTYLPSLQICTFSLLANLLVLGIYPFLTMAQDPPPKSQEQAANPTNNIAQDLAPEILAEINRVRTNPQGYASWLEAQRQYYDGSWIRLPGEKPLRTTSRGIKALNEAIASLRELQPLPPLEVSEATTSLAADKLDDFATAHNIQFISYGRTTPKGIVMSLVIDELFPDRRRRNSLLSSEASNTGVVCKPDPRYAKVCAIAYSDSPSSPGPEATPEVATNTNSGSTQPPAPQPPSPPVPASPPEAAETADLPSPPVPASPPEPTEKPEVVTANPPNPPVPTPPIPESSEPEETSEATTDPPSPPVPTPPIPESPEEATEEEPVVEDASEETEVAVNSDPPQLEESAILENVERGVLEDGDRVIAEDGSFYDSYPLEAKQGESFIIYLESEEFDAFVALIDSKGNIIEQNDDIGESDSNSRIRVTIPENGTYNIIVNAYDEGGQGKYILTVRR